MKAENLIFVLLLVPCVMGKPSISDSVVLLKCKGDSFCVDYMDCENGKVNTDGSHIRDVRSAESTCHHYTDVCCDISNILPEVKPKSEPSAPASEDDSLPKCGFRNKQGLGSQEDTVDEKNAKFGKNTSIIIREVNHFFVHIIYM